MPPDREGGTAPQRKPPGLPEDRGAPATPPDPLRSDEGGHGQARDRVPALGGALRRARPPGAGPVPPPARQGHVTVGRQRGRARPSDRPSAAGPANRVPAGVRVAERGPETGGDRRRGTPLAATAVACATTPPFRTPGPGRRRRRVRRARRCLRAGRRPSRRPGDGRGARSPTGRPSHQRGDPLGGDRPRPSNYGIPGVPHRVSGARPVHPRTRSPHSARISPAR